MDLWQPDLWYLSTHLVVGFAVALVYLVILWQHGTQGEMGATSLICLER